MLLVVYNCGVSHVVTVLFDCGGCHVVTGV